MTIEALEQLLKSGDLQAVVSFFAGKSEKERKEYSDRIDQWMRLAVAIATTPEVTLQEFKTNPEWFSKKDLENCRQIAEFDEGKLGLPPEAGERDRWQIVAAAALSCCNFISLKRYGEIGLCFGATTAYDLLVDRKPNFIDKWLLLAIDLKPLDFLGLARRMEIEGLADFSGSSVYYWATVQSLGQTGKSEDIVSEFSSNREWLEKCIWSLFADHETIMKLMTSGLSAPGARGVRIHSSLARVWSNAFIYLAERDEAFRKRLLPTLIDQLSRVSIDSENKKQSGKRYNINYSISGTAIDWLTQILDRLALSPEEVEHSVSGFIGILATRDGKAIEWSLTKLMMVDPRRLPVRDLLANIAGAFTQKFKDPAIKALELLQSISRADASYSVPVSVAAIIAFEHKSTAVRQRALKLVESCDAIDDARVRDELLYRMDSLSGLDREKVRALLHTASGAQAVVDEGEGPAEDEVANLLETAQNYTGELAEAAGIADAVEYLAGKRGYIEALELRSGAIPRLVPETLLKPVDSLDNLLYLFLQILDGKPTSEQLELALDGILRMCDQSPPDWEDRVSALRKRMDDRFQDGVWATGKVFSGYGYLWDMAGVATVWIDGDIGLPNIRRAIERLTVPPTISGFFSARAQRVAQKVVKRQSSLLLALPSHAGGFIDPRALVDRLAFYRENQWDPDSVDVIQAILRLAPEHRADALRQLDHSGEEIESAIAYALGEEIVDSSVMNHPALWVAASRARAPFKEDQLLRSKFGIVGPDGSFPAIYFQYFKSAPESQDSNTRQNERDVKDVLVVCPETEIVSVDIPTVSIHSDTRFSDAVFDLLWPGNKESFFNYEARRTYLHLNNTGDHRLGAWECLFDPDTPLVGNASYLIGLAMSARQPEANRFAVDALIAAVEDGRLSGTLFGIALRDCWKAGVIMSRWVKVFLDVSKVSPLHSLFARQSLESFYSGTGQYSVPMLELWLNLCSEQGEQVYDDTARQYLAAMTGSGKTTKLAQLLLSLSNENNDAHIAASGTLALSRRIERLERWQTSLSRTRESAKEARSVNLPSSIA